MEKPVFNSRALSTDEIIDMLQGQGLIIDDRDRATHILHNVSYTRLKNYIVYFYDDRKAHRFRQGSSFEMAYALYGFDRRLRELIFHEIEKIEISIRTHIAYASNGSENGYWYLNPEHFKSRKSHEGIIRKLKMEIDRSDNEGILRFKEKYSNDFPPCWLTLEAASMGTLSVIYNEMVPGKLKTKIAEYFSLSEMSFASWLHHLVEVRNDCAHHSRMWNAISSSRPMLPASTAKPFPRLEGDGHIYTSLCIIKYFVDTVKPTNTFTQRLSTLIDNFPIIRVSDMGFPENWLQHPLWKNTL